jgi:hypothetical protein
MKQPKVAAGTLSAPEQARQRAELGARYAVAGTAVAGKSLASPMVRPAFADQVEALAATSTKSLPGRLSDAQEAAFLKDIAGEMSKRPALAGGAPFNMSTEAFEDMKRNVERLRK